MGLGTAGGLPEGPAAHKIAAEEIIEAKQEKLAEKIGKQLDTRAENLENLHEKSVNLLAKSSESKKKNIAEHAVSLRKVVKPEEKQKVLPEREVKDQASRFEKRNPELKEQVLLLLLSKIKDCRDKEEVLKILQEFYPDPSVADEALDFLLLTTAGFLREIIQSAKEAFNEQRGREIRAGKNISEQVQEYVTLGLGTPSKLRDLYRDITGNPRDPIALFLELGDRFNYKELRKVLAYLFHALGSDLKSQGPSIPPGFLHRLLSEVRNLQAGLGILRFFKARMKLIQYLFQRNDLPLPKLLTFETMSRQFITLLQERYPTPDKVLQLAEKLGVSKEILAKIILLSQMRDAVREIALFHFYRSVQHRDEIYKSILEALEQLEEELDELLEEEYEEEDLLEEEGEAKKGEEEEEVEVEEKEE